MEIISAQTDINAFIMASRIVVEPGNNYVTNDVDDDDEGDCPPHEGMERVADTVQRERDVRVDQQQGMHVFETFPVKRELRDTEVCLPTLNGKSDFRITEASESTERKVSNNSLENQKVKNSEIEITQMTNNNEEKSVFQPSESIHQVGEEVRTNSIGRNPGFQSAMTERSTFEKCRDNASTDSGQGDIEGYGSVKDKEENEDADDESQIVALIDQENKDDPDGISLKSFLNIFCGLRKRKTFEDDNSEYGFLVKNDKETKIEAKESKERGQSEVKTKETIAKTEGISQLEDKDSTKLQKQFTGRSKEGTDVKSETESKSTHVHTELKCHAHKKTSRESKRRQDPDVYDFSNRHRGYAVVVVNERFKKQSFRCGAKRDLQKAKEVCKKLGFFIYNDEFDFNLSRKDTMDVLKTVQSRNFTNHDCFMFIISTHGLELERARTGGKPDHALIFSDEGIIYTSDIVDMFSDENCPTLKGKPKFFFIQACRGFGKDFGVSIRVYKGPNAKAIYSTSHGISHSDETVIKNNDRQTVSELGLASHAGDQSDTKFSLDTWATTVPFADENQRNPRIPSSVPQQRDPSHSSFRPPVYRETAFASSRPSHMSQPYSETSISGGTRPGSSGSSASSRFSDEQSQAGDTKPQETAIIKCHPDCLVMYGIPSGNFAWRSTEDGSWMLHYLHEVIEKYSLRKPISFVNLLTKVARNMSYRQTNTPASPHLHGAKAIPVVEHMFTKDALFGHK